MAGVRLERFEYCVRAWPGPGPVAGRVVIRFIAGLGAENHRHKRGLRGLARRHPDARAGCQVRQGGAWPVGPQDIAQETPLAHARFSALALPDQTLFPALLPGDPALALGQPAAVTASNLANRK